MLVCIFPAEATSSKQHLLVSTGPCSSLQFQRAQYTIAKNMLYTALEAIVLFCKSSSIKGVLGFSGKGSCLGPRAQGASTSRISR